jgi:hypothetical protein
MYNRYQLTRVEKKRSYIHVGWPIVDHTIVSTISNRTYLLRYIVWKLDFVITEELVELGHDSEPEKKDICRGRVRRFKALDGFRKWSYDFSKLGQIKFKLYCRHGVV